MKFKKILLTIFFAFHLTLSLKSIDFCIAKQETCKGFYDEQHDYQTKCEPNKCHGKFSYDCVSNTCSLNRKSCNEYKIALSRFLQIINDLKASDSVFSSKHLAEINSVFNVPLLILCCILSNIILLFTQPLKTHISCSGVTSTSEKEYLDLIDKISLSTSFFITFITFL